MIEGFKYKPKFMDIRVRPPKEGETEGGRRPEDDVLHLKPGQKRCEWPECSKVATARAPKSREMMNEYYNFCTGHAAEYNKNWNFFAGMSEGEARRHRESIATGDRPTWAFRASRQSREAAAFAAKMGAGKASDPFGLFGEKARAAKAKADERRLGRLEKRTLA